MKVSRYASQWDIQLRLGSPDGPYEVRLTSAPGDQMFPDVALSTNGGFVVWQDNYTDGDGCGISARRLDPTLSGTLGSFRVNAIGAGNQQNPRVALLKNGGAVFVWQGGAPGAQHIFARFLTQTNTFVGTNDLQVSAFAQNFQAAPAVATRSATVTKTKI